MLVLFFRGATMEWIKTKDDLPKNGSYVLARIGNGSAVLCQFKNDSFGLGDDDMWISSWKYLVVSNQEPPRKNPRSTLQAADHKDVDSLKLSENLGALAMSKYG